MISAYAGLAAIGLTILGCISLAFWQEAKDMRRTPRPASLPRTHPGVMAARRRQVPGLPVDGRPLSPGEWDEFVGTLFRSDSRYEPAEPDYGSR